MPSRTVLSATGIKPEPTASQQRTGPLYVVAHGSRRGVYNNEEGARAAVEAFGGRCHRKVADRTAALAWLRTTGVEDADIHFFRSTFVTGPNYAPAFKTSFNDEFDRFAASQQLSNNEKREAKVRGIRDEIIHHYLPRGVRFKGHQQEDDDINADLDNDEFLEIFQRMCKAAGKSVHPTIDDSLTELKNCPYVNILDFIDSCRTGRPIRTFVDWTRFTKYTLKDRKVDLLYASQDEFLAPLLQNLRKGPGAVDPISVHRGFMAERQARRRQREADAIESLPVTALQEIPRSLSPSFFDQDSKQSSPAEPASPAPSNLNATECTQTPRPVKSETLSSLTTFPANSSPIGSEISDNELIELFMRVERSTQELDLLKRRLKSPSATSDISDISDSDLIELSMRLEASNQATRLTSDEAIDLLARTRKAEPVPGKHSRSSSSSTQPLSRSKRMRKGSLNVNPPDT